MHKVNGAGCKRRQNYVRDRIITIFIQIRYLIKLLLKKNLNRNPSVVVSLLLFLRKPIWPKSHNMVERSTHF